MSESVKLFDPLTIRGCRLPNRIVVSPLCQYSAVDGFAQPWHFAHLSAFARGKAGLVFTEATAVEERGRINRALSRHLERCAGRGLAPYCRLHRVYGMCAGYAARACRAQGVDARAVC